MDAIFFDYRLGPLVLGRDRLREKLNCETKHH